MKNLALYYRWFLIIFVVVILFNTTTLSGSALYDPRSVPNNPYGIHVLNIDDIPAAEKLVNSSGGEWGYVTLVIREDERQTERWQLFFDELRKKKIIPLVRLATRFENGHWIKPRTEDIDSWVTFLNSLNWVVENRYVILFNEPNHTREWGSQLNPEEYAQIVREFYTKLKQVSPDYFILPAGLDLGPENTATTMHPYNYLKRMSEEDENIFNLFDGWTSHSYPNPGFSASPTKTGRTSIRGYEWELATLKEFGLTKDLPVFITETGWMHSEGKTPSTGLLSPDVVSEYFKTAFTQVWNSKNIVAVTPFILNYPEPPFDVFSWQIANKSEFHPFYAEVMALPKSAGIPNQKASSQWLNKYFPTEYIVDSQYALNLKILNTGQSIWDASNTQLIVDSTLPKGSVIVDTVPITEPNKQARIWLRINTPKLAGEYQITITAIHRNQLIMQPIEYTINLLSDTPLTRVRLWLQKLLYYPEQP